MSRKFLAGATRCLKKQEKSNSTLRAKRASFTFVAEFLAWKFKFNFFFPIGIFRISYFVEITRFFPEMQSWENTHFFRIYTKWRNLCVAHLAQFASLLAKKTNKSVGKKRRKSEMISHACIQKCWENWPWRISLRLLWLENFIRMNK